MRAHLRFSLTAAVFLAATGSFVLPANAITSCVGIPTPFQIIDGGTFTVRNQTETSEQRYCMGPSTELQLFGNTYTSTGSVRAYLPFNTTDARNFVSVFFLNSTFDAANIPAFTHERLPSQLAGPLVVSFLDSSIGRGRSIDFVSASGAETQASELYFADQTGTSTLDSVIITNPTQLVFGAYKDRTFIHTPTHVLFTRSVATGVSNTVVTSGSRLTMELASSIGSFSFDNYGTVAGDGVFDVVRFNQRGGRIEPGQSIGTLVFNGFLEFTAPSTLLAEVDPLGAQTADLVDVELDVTGADKLTVQVETANPAALASDYPAANNYRVLIARSVDSNAITIVEGGSLPAVLSVSLVPSPTSLDSVELAFKDNSAVPNFLPSKTQIKNSTNAQKLVSAIVATNLKQPVNGQQGGNGGPQTPLVNQTPLTTAVSSVTNNQMTGFNYVHAEPYSSYLTVGLQHMDRVAATIFNQTSGALRSRAGIPEKKEGNDRFLWGTAIGSHGNISSGNRLGGFDYTLTDLVAGSDVLASPQGYVGIFGALGYQHLSGHDFVRQTLHGTNFLAGGYGAYTAPQFTLAGLVGYYLGENRSKRENRNVGQFTGGKATSSFFANGVFVGAQLSRDFFFSDVLEITPNVAFDYAGYWQGEAKESGGGDFRYTIKSVQAHSIVTSIGVDFRSAIGPVENQLDGIGFARYQYDWNANMNSGYEITAASSRFGDITQVGRNRGPHGVVAGVGLSSNVSKSLDILAGVFGAVYSHGTEVGGEARIRFRW